MKKSVGVLQSLVPHTEAFALPTIAERATQKPTPICKTHLIKYTPQNKVYFKAK